MNGMATPDVPLPVVILAGSDRERADLPESAKDLHALGGYKGLRIRLGGRPLVACIAERLRVSEAFSRIFVAGPARLFGAFGDGVEIVDTDGSFGENIRAAIDSVAPRCPGQSIAFTSCDILPRSDRMRALVDSWRASGPLDIWFPLVRIPENRERLRASGWKPSYAIAPERGRPPERLLPGHLVVADPEALNLHFVFRLLDEGYRTRNRAVAYRRVVMARALLGELLRSDAAEMAALRPPVVTWSILRAGLARARELGSGTSNLVDLEDAIRTIFMRPSHRRKHPERRVKLPVVDEVWLARDIDTWEEAEAEGGEVV